MTSRSEDTLAHRISRVLADRIIAGQIEPGARLRQDHIAEEFGASHVPVREAFRHLESRGLAVSEPRRGDWVEFRDEDGHTSRERLNWISPQRGILLFSNHRAAKAISIAPEALARQIRDEKAWIVQQEAIFERALSGALDSIKAN